MLGRVKGKTCDCEYIAYVGGELIVSDIKWKQFVIDGRTDIDIRKEVLQSWNRCKSLGVSHERTEVFSYLSPDEVDRRRKENHELIVAARPIMEELRKRLKGGGYLLLLADTDGYSVEMATDKKSQKLADQSGIFVGARWTEENVGSTGLSIAIRTRSSFVTSGSEHYCLALRSWDCSACPIIVQGKHIGTFDVCRMGPKNDLKELYTLAAAGAQAISARYQFNKVKIKEQVLSHILADYVPKINDRTGILSFDNLGVELYKNNPAEAFLERLNERGETSAQHLRELNSTELELGGNKYFIDRKELALEGRPLATVLLIEDRSRETAPQTKKKSENPLFHSENPVFRKTVQMAKKASKSDACILINGESGVGKDFMARFIHHQSNRSIYPYTALNCAALPRELITSELFGYESGAFTGAKQKGQMGKIEASNNGTIFLDEIGDLPLDLQATLLRALEEKQIVRIGGNRPVPINVRFLAATNKNLKQLVEQGKFREDLYYRLNVFNVKIPPLRERTEDFETILTHITNEICKKAQRQAITFTQEAIDALRSYSWPGNIRELRNMAERIVYLHDEDTFDLLHAHEFLMLDEDPKEEVNEKEYISHVLREAGGNRSKAAKEIGISRSALYRKIEKYNLQ